MNFEDSMNFNQFVGGIKQGEDWANSREDRALKLKRDAEDRANQVISDQYKIKDMARVDAAKQTAFDVSGIPEFQELKKQTEELQQQVTAAQGKDINNTINQVSADPEWRNNFEATRTKLMANPTFVKQFGDAGRPVSSDIPSDRQAVSKYLASAGLPINDESIKNAVEHGNLLINSEGTLIDLTGVGIATGAYKTATVEQKKAMEDKLNKAFSTQTKDAGEKALGIKPDTKTQTTAVADEVNSGESKPFELGSEPTPADKAMNSVNPPPAQEGTTPTAEPTAPTPAEGTQVAPKLEDIDFAEADKSQKAAEAYTTKVTDSVADEMAKANNDHKAALENSIKALNTSPTPEAQATVSKLAQTNLNMELVRRIAGYKDAPPIQKVHKLQEEVKTDTIKELMTKDINTPEGKQEFQDLYKKMYGKAGAGSGETATIRTIEQMSEMADNVNGDYTPTQVKVAKDWIEAHNPNKATSTMRNIDYKDQHDTEQAEEALGAPPSNNPMGTGKYAVDKLGKLPPPGQPGTRPLVGPTGTVVPNARQPLPTPAGQPTPQQIKEQVAYEKGIDKATLKSVKTDAVDLSKRAQSMQNLKDFTNHVNKLYSNGKMNAGYVDDFFQYIGERVPMKNGSIDQTLATAKIKDYVVKAVQDANGKAASNQEAQRQLEIIFGGNGLQEEQRKGLFNQFVNTLDKDYKNTRERMKDSKQYSAIAQADKYYNPSSEQKVLNKRDGKYYIKQANGKFRLAE